MTPSLVRRSSRDLSTAPAPGGPEATRAGLAAFFGAQPGPFGVPLAVLRLLRYDFGWSTFGRPTFCFVAALDASLEGARLNAVAVDEHGARDGTHSLAELLLGGRTEIPYRRSRAVLAHSASKPPIRPPSPLKGARGASLSGSDQDWSLAAAEAVAASAIAEEVDVPMRDASADRPAGSPERGKALLASTTPRSASPFATLGYASTWPGVTTPGVAPGNNLGVTAGAGSRTAVGFSCGDRAGAGQRCLFSSASLELACGCAADMNRPVVRCAGKGEFCCSCPPIATVARTATLPAC